MAGDGTVEGSRKSAQLSATVVTDKGEIKLELFPEQAPLTVANFVNLARRGYYDGVKFHRVIADFMIQGGDPTGTGSGGPGYKFKDEFSPKLRHNSAGVLSMANSGPGTNGSQFFITHKATPWLDDKHTIFGKVTSGQNVVDAISKGDVMKTITISGDPSKLFEENKEQLAEWNKILDKRYPKKSTGG
ncbi:MAG: peptidylprolyl isomerase [Phycisphaerae bacterium]